MVLLNYKTGTGTIVNVKVQSCYDIIHCICCQVLQNLGKADRTTDNSFEQHVVNFTDQQV